ncbi:uncharacterized protein AB9X84_007141 isoform 2-T2 [Acanthopagrus schlegelii]
MKSTRLCALCVALLVVGNITTSIALSVVKQLGCTHDFDRMSCDLDAPTCSGYSLTLRCLSSNDLESCIFKQCDRGKCCCSTQMSLIYGENHNATVWKGDENLASKIISVADRFKPRVPTDVAVEESNGNFKVTWWTNMDHRPSVRDDLRAIVTYRIKGDTAQVSEPFKPTTVMDGRRCYEINGKHLKPSTTYLISVRSVYWNNLSSDSSQEVEFTTSMSPDVPRLAIIISFSIAAVIISGVIYGCFAKAKTVWWDSVAKCPNPRLLDMHPRMEEVLKPVRPLLSPISVEPLIPDDSKSWSKGSLHDGSSGSPQQSSGISTGSSCTSYANTEPVDIVASVEEALRKAFPNISPISPLTTSPFQEINPAIDLISSPYNLCDVRADDVNSGSSGFDNKTYSILIPNLPHPTLLESSEVQMQCDSTYHPSQGDVVIYADQQIPACPLITFPPAASSLIPMEMSYQQCSLDSGTFSCAEDSNLSSSSSCTNPIAPCDPAFRVENGCERSDEAVGDAAKLNGTHEVAIKCDENPCYGCVPAVSHSFPPVNDDYQAFQNLVGQPDILFTEQRSDEEEEHLDKYPEESISEMPEISLNPAGPGFFDNVQGAKCLSELERPLTGSSCTSYANTEPVDVVASVEDAHRKAFPNISPISPLTTSPFQEMNPAIDLISSPYNLCDVRADDVNSGSSGFDSKTYSILIPNLPHPTLLESSKVQMQCDSAYHPSQGDIAICADQQVQACPLITFPPAASSLIPMEMSYQQCSLDSGTFSCAEDSSLSSSSSSTNPIAPCDPAFRVENGCERSDEAFGDATKLNGTHEVAIKCDENPCYGCVPAVSHSFPPVNDDYQAFQNLVGQPDILFTEQRSDEEEEHLDKYPEESISEMPEISLYPTVPGFFDNFQGAKCLPELERSLTGSSCTSYANTEPVDVVAGVEALRKAFPNINLISPLSTSPFQEMNPAIDLISSPYNLCDVRADDVNSGSSGFDSKTYSILIPNLPHPTLLESSEVQMQCDSAYHPSRGDIVICADQQIPACPLITFPPAASSLIPMDMSYQQCSLDSERFSCAEDSSLSSSSSSTNPIAPCDPAFRVDNGCERSDETFGDATKLNGTHEVAIKCDENPCYGCVPAVSHSFPPVNDDYQAFQNLVGQPDILFAEQRSDEEEEHLDKYPEESISEMPEISLNPASPGFFDNVQGAKCLPELERPLLSLLSASQSMPAFTEGGYQSV